MVRLFSPRVAWLWLVPAVVVSVLALGAECASAQVPRPDPQFRGLFGGNSGPANEGASLSMNASTYGGYDQNVLSGQAGGPVDSRLAQSSAFFGGDVSLGYAYRGRRHSLFASWASSMRYYPDLEANRFLSHQGGGIGLSSALSRRTTFSLNQGLSYSPYFQYNLLPPLYRPELGDAVAFNPNLALNRSQTLLYSTSAALTHQVSRRANATLDYTFMGTRFGEAQRENDLTSHMAGGIFSYQITPHTSAVLGYHYRRGAFGHDADANTVENHDINVGVNYSRAFEVTRKTTVAFSTGTTVTRVNGANFFMVIGSANLGRVLSRGWHASASYQRNVQYVSGLLQPVFYDAIVGGLSGQMGRRVTLTTTGGWSTGTVGPSGPGGNGFDTTYASASTQVALNRYLALTANYAFYRYGFGDDVTLPDALTQRFDRHTVYAGLSFWLPLVR